MLQKDTQTREKMGREDTAAAEMTESGTVLSLPVPFAVRRGPDLSISGARYVPLGVRRKPVRTSSDPRPRDLPRTPYTQMLLDLQPPISSRLRMITTSVAIRKILFEAGCVDTCKILQRRQWRTAGWCWAKFWCWRPNFAAVESV